MRSSALALLLLAAPIAAEPGPVERVRAALAQAGPGTRFGLLITDADGRELIAIDPDGRYMPASNTKLFTTAAAFATLPNVTAPDAAGGAAVRLEPGPRGVPDVVLVGGGDARLSSAEDCRVDCLATLADAVAARTRRVGAVVGDDSLFPDERWSPGMSWNNIPGPYGTGISALTLDDNELVVRVSPGALGGAPTTALLPYYTIENRAVTVAGGKTSLDITRLPNARTVRLTGTIAAGAEPATVRMGIDDPAHYAAWRLAALLRARGVAVGGLAVRHRPLGPGDDPAQRGSAPPARPSLAEPLARLVPPPLVEDLTVTNKVSQNLHAELLLRRTGLVAGTGSLADGHAVVTRLLTEAGTAPAGYTFADGSGMSTYNRVAPRATVALLNWGARQPWGAAWRATFPIAATDGTLRSRFRETPLAGRLFAKTGSLNATNALAGYLIAKSGRTLTFAIYANDVPGEVRATQAMDAALVAAADAF